LFAGVYTAEAIEDDLSRNPDELENMHFRNIIKKTHEDELIVEPSNRTFFLTRSVHRNAIVLPIVLYTKTGESVQTYALVDSGATDSFISSDFVANCGIHIRSTSIEPVPFTMANQTTGVCSNQSFVGMAPLRN
jgi:hypothetical protein